MSDIVLSFPRRACPQRRRGREPKGSEMDSGQNIAGMTSDYFLIFFNAKTQRCKDRREDLVYVNISLVFLMVKHIYVCVDEVHYLKTLHPLRLLSTMDLCCGIQEWMRATCALCVNINLKKRNQ